MCWLDLIRNFVDQISWLFFWQFWSLFFLIFFWNFTFFLFDQLFCWSADLPDHQFWPDFWLDLDLTEWVNILYAELTWSACWWANLMIFMHDHDHCDHNDHYLFISFEFFRLFCNFCDFFSILWRLWNFENCYWSSLRTFRSKSKSF